MPAAASACCHICRASATDSRIASVLTLVRLALAVWLTTSGIRKQLRATVEPDILIDPDQSPKNPGTRSALGEQLPCEPSDESLAREHAEPLAQSGLKANTRGGLQLSGRNPACTPKPASPPARRLGDDLHAVTWSHRASDLPLIARGRPPFGIWAVGCDRDCCKESRDGPGFGGGFDAGG